MEGSGGERFVRGSEFVVRRHGMSGERWRECWQSMVKKQWRRVHSPPAAVTRSRRSARCMGEGSRVGGERSTRIIPGRCHCRTSRATHASRVQCVRCFALALSECWSPPVVPNANMGEPRRLTHAPGLKAHPSSRFKAHPSSRSVPLHLLTPNPSPLDPAVIPPPLTPIPCSCVRRAMPRRLVVLSPSIQWLPSDYPQHEFSPSGGAAHAFTTNAINRWCRAPHRQLPGSGRLPHRHHRGRRPLRGPRR